MINNRQPKHSTSCDNCDSVFSPEGEWTFCPINKRTHYGDTFIKFSQINASAFSYNQALFIRRMIKIYG